MRTLLKNGIVLNVFIDEFTKENVLIENDRIIGVGDYTDEDADNIIDVSNKYIAPSFIDGHFHIESTMLTPANLAKVCLTHGTTSVFADPHEIANVCGIKGVEYMLKASEGIPFDVFIMAPSCVPATMFDESGAVLEAEDLEVLYNHDRVKGLAEMMNYPGVIGRDPVVMEKIANIKARGKRIDGHAPLLSGRDLDKYIYAGIKSDHECTNIEEAKEKIKKGQYVIIREGSAAKNLNDLNELFNEPYNRRCFFCTDDKNPVDIINEGHIDNVIRKFLSKKLDIFAAYRMASLHAAQYFGFHDIGAIVPGYRANLLVMDDVVNVSITDVFYNGRRVVKNGELVGFTAPRISRELEEVVLNSFNVRPLNKNDFYIEPKGKRCRVIGLVKGQILTENLECDIDFNISNGIDVERDIIKLAVIERHKNTGHIGLGFVKGFGLKEGAMASSVSHDSHNLIVVGANEADMAVAANHIRAIGGGMVVVKNGVILSEFKLPIAGLMSDKDANVVALQNSTVRQAVYELGVDRDIEPFMNMAFVSLPVIPSLKMTTMGLVDVDKFERVSLFV